MNENTSQTTAAQAIGDHAFYRNMHQAQTRSAVAAYLLWFLFGGLGAHLMYTRRWVMLGFHYLFLILTGVGVAMVFNNNSIHSLGTGLGALWGAFLPFGIFNFFGMCILFVQVNYCNEDAAIKLAGGQPVAARTVEGLVIFVSVTVFAIFAALMQNNPKADLYMPGDHKRTADEIAEASSAKVAIDQYWQSQKPSTEPNTLIQTPGMQAPTPSAETIARETGLDAEMAEKAAQAQAVTQYQDQIASATGAPVTSTDFTTYPNQIFATSFDCNNSRTQNEYLICHTPALAAQDVKLANAVFAVKAMFGGPDLDALKNRMRGQWNFREKHCNDVACLNTW
ncbi:NINE protein [Burkholderia vietnamiensis]|nr:NINE protein [Burkholderia vietnamiensis]